MTEKNKKVKEKKYICVSKDGNKNGKCKYKFSNGCIYDGQWKDNKMHGNGIMKF